jgi:hypothetical protein
MWKPKKRLPNPFGKNKDKECISTEGHLPSALFSYRDIVKQIFLMLPPHDWNSVLNVCSDWNKVKKESIS